MSRFKPTVMLIPGFLCDERVWAPQCEALAESFEVHVMLFSGQETFRAKAEHALASVPGSFSLVGHSMGAKVGLEMLHIAPERIDRAVLMSTGVHAPGAHEAVQRQRMLDRAEAMGMEVIAEELLTQMLHPVSRQDDALVDTLRKMILKHSLQALRRQVKASLTRPEQARYLRDIQQPVLLMCGDSDAWSPISQHEEMLADLSRGVLRVIENCGHMLTLEKKEPVNQLLLDWLLCSEIAIAQPA